MRKKSKPTNATDSLHGWQQIASFLSRPISVGQRWSKSGMPVTRQDRRVHASKQERSRWLARESGGESVQIANQSSDLSSELKRGLLYLRKPGPRGKRKLAA
jgi:hypothetical protein